MRTYDIINAGPKNRFMANGRIVSNSGRLIQPQNLPRNHLDCMSLARDLVKARKLDAIRVIYGNLADTLSQLTRTALIPSPGHLFVVADFSAIEARITAWLAGEEWVLEVFRTHGKIYEATAAQMFGVPLERIVKGNPEYELRQKGKVATLALGYGGGSGALINMGALKQGLTEDELPEIVQRWRAANRRIVGLWYTVENAALEVMRTGQAVGVRGLIFAREGDGQQDWLTVRLPSGRKLYYAKPAIELNDRGNEQLSYQGTTMKGGKPERTSTWGGKLVENLVQSIARDCLAVSLMRLAAAGYKIAFHVHDEIVLDVPAEQADVDAVTTIMGQPIDWAPGLPLKAEGFVCEYYRKD